MAQNDTLMLRSRVKNESKEFLKLKAYFNYDSLYSHNVGHKIPVSLLNKFISRLNGAEAKYYSEGNAYDYFSNRDGHYFLIRLVCGGGGYCEEYDLIRFDQEGHFISSETIGNLNMEYGNTLSFEYHLLSDTALSVYEVETDTESLKSRDFSHQIVKLFPSPN